MAKKKATDEEQREAAVAFLREHPRKIFKAAELSAATRIPPLFLRRLLRGHPEVYLTPRDFRYVPPPGTVIQMTARETKWIKKQGCSALKPITRQENDPVIGSKFGGKPWLPHDAAWPTMGKGKAPLALFLQLNLDNLPKPMRGKFGKGLLQYFRSTKDLQGLAHLVRVVHPRGSGLESSPLSVAPFPCKTIVDWERIEDYPGQQEYSHLGHPEESYFESDEQMAQEYPCQPGDKLGGWPYWIQWRDYPNCSRCKCQMRFLFQMDSHDNIPYDFGDSGIVSFFQCPTHKEEVSVREACC